MMQTWCTCSMRLFVCSRLPDRSRSSGAALQRHPERRPGDVRHPWNVCVCKPNLSFLLEQRDCTFNLHFMYCCTTHFISLSSLSSLTDGLMSFLCTTLCLTNTVVKDPIAGVATPLMLESLSLCVLLLGKCLCHPCGPWWRARQGKFCRTPRHSTVFRWSPVWFQLWATGAYVCLNIYIYELAS